MVNVKNPYSEEIQGFILAQTLLHIAVPIIVKNINSSVIPDGNGNAVRIKKIKFIKPNRSAIKVVKQGDKSFSICSEYANWGELPFFQHNEKELKYKYLKFDTKNGAYHPDFLYRPLFNFQFTELYKGLTIKNVIEYLTNTKTSTFEKSFYRGPGKDDGFVEYQKIEFDEPPERLFFNDLLQVFDIYWYDNEKDKYGLALELGNGFFRLVDNSFAYASVEKWTKLNDNKGLSDIVKWFEIINENNPFKKDNEMI